jgi:RNA polymerase sigma-70 factor (TIGR02943 family)
MNYILEPKDWIKNYADYLFKHAFFKINNQEQAEDLVQETFLSAYKNKDSFKGEASEKTWLTRILKNKIIDFYRKRAVESKAFDISSSNDDAFFRDNENEPYYDHWKPNAVPQALQLDGLQALEQRELSKQLVKCFGLLPEQWNQICQLKLIDHENTEEVCKIFNISSSNLWVILHRAKLQLRDCLQKNWIHD